MAKHPSQMSGRDRNKPCWCGSGKKFKNCHRERELQQPPKLWQAREQLSRAAETSLCLHPEAGPAVCDKTIVRAHTVRRSADLKAIARNGHVYQTSADLGDLHRNNGELVAKLIGINRASTFRGFCSKHDSSTFAPIETADLAPTDEQAFLLAYRALCKELYEKERQLESMAIVRQSDKGRSIDDQYRVQEFAFLMETGIEAGLKDLRRHKAMFDADLLAADFSNMRFAALELAETPEIMCSSAVQPEFTFDGARIQDLGDLATPLQFISLTLAATPSGGVAVFSWRSDSDEASSKLVDSLFRLTNADLANAIARFVLSNIENAFFQPSWWENLPTDARKAASARIRQNVGPEDQVAPHYLADDGVQYVDWKIVGNTQRRN